MSRPGFEPPELEFDALNTGFKFDTGQLAEANDFSDWPVNSEQDKSSGLVY